MSGELGAAQADDDLLIVVNDRDEVMDYLPKVQCHDGEGILHRAFSIFVFNSERQLLVQRRSEQKRLWPMFWSNSCCSHPRRGEEIEQAARRRLGEELGLEAPLRYLFKFQYHARFGAAGSERELCSVLIGRTDQTAVLNPDEIREIRFEDLATLDDRLSSHGEEYTPWFQMEWQRIRAHHEADINALW